MLIRRVASWRHLSTAFFLFRSLLHCQHYPKHISAMSTFTSSGISCPIYNFDEVTSTMDKAKELAGSLAADEAAMFAVRAKSQTAGRGTKGRAWDSPSNNLYLTIAINLNLLPLTLTLVPLRVGSIIVPAIKDIVGESVDVHLKWPNDVLIFQKKVCGVLIEIENQHMVVGIGCNVMMAPEVSISGVNGGRPATCIANYIQSSETETESESDAESVGNELCETVAEKIRDSFVGWINNGLDTSSSVIRDCNGMLDYSPQFIRNEYLRRASPSKSSLKFEDDELEAMSSKGENILPLRINEDGTLQVFEFKSGTEKTLIADYLW